MAQHQPIIPHELILKHEFEAAHAKYIAGGTSRPTIELVLWRGANGKGFPAFWLVRLAKKQYGLLAKVGKQWT